jgi:hypothetical protein
MKYLFLILMMVLLLPINSNTYDEYIDPLDVNCDTKKIYIHIDNIDSVLNYPNNFDSVDSLEIFYGTTDQINKLLYKCNPLTIKKLIIRLNEPIELSFELNRLENLEVLMLSNANTPNINHTFLYLPKLRYLELSRMLIDTLTTSVNSLKYLERIIIENTYIKGISNKIRFPERMVSLRIASNDSLALDDINNLLLNNKKLTELVIKGNYDFSKFDYPLNLRYLYIACKDIQDFPPNLKLCRDIDDLWLRNFKLTNLPDEFSYLKNLKYLYLTDCTIDNYFVDYSNFKKLEVLQISSEYKNKSDSTRSYLKNALPNTSVNY